VDRLARGAIEVDGRSPAIPRVRIAGGGLAGLAAAAALGSLGFHVDLHEARPFLGGRATSFPLSPSEEDSERIDNCQHVLLRCCDNLLDFYRRCGVEDKIRFYGRLNFVRPGGAVDVLKPGVLPAPLHLLGSFVRFRPLSASDRWLVARALAALLRERRRFDLDSFTMGQWLAEKQMTRQAIDRFWRPILVSALNEEPERASALPAFQVFRQGLLASRRSYQMGVPAVPLADLYSAALEARLGREVRVHLRSTVERLDPDSGEADFYISAVPFERVESLIPGLRFRLAKFEHSPITGVHLWYDRPLTDLPHAVLLDRTLQWLFRKSETYVLAVVSASRSLLEKSKAEIVELAAGELREFFPASQSAKLLRSHVVKETRATYSAVPGLESQRPATETIYPNVFLAGDWTSTGWPATMEGAVRSGYRAAEAVARAAGIEARFVV
jgi:zeta-carotene desaturase